MKEAADKLKPLAAARRQITVRLNDTRKYLRDLKKQMKEFRKLHKKDTEGLHNKLMDVLKKVGVELQAYHGGSLNGKDIIKVMNNASYIFDQFTSLLHEGEGRRDGCTLTKEDIEKRCEEYKSAFLLWDGAFSFARKLNPENVDREMYRRFVTQELCISTQSSVALRTKFT